MPAFEYMGIDRSGRNRAGKMLAADELELEEKLRGLGLWLVSAKTEKVETRIKTRRRWQFLEGGTSRREMINFCTLMSFQLKVGIPMVTALQVTSEDCESPQFKEVLINVKKHIEAGAQLAEALERFPKVFPPQFISLVHAGESSSSLPDTFAELKRYMEWQEQIMADVKQATIYPAVVLGTVITLVVVLFSFVVPRFVVLLTQLKVELPLPTRIVFGMSDVIKATWWIWLVAVTVLPLTISWLKRRYPKFAIAFDQAKFALPLFGSLNRMLAVSRFARNLGILYSSGVVLISSLKLCRSLVGSPWISAVLEEIVTRVESGETLSEALRRYPVFPGLLVRMVAMGEKTGKLDEALENVADYYSTIVPRRIKRIFAIAEPMMIIFLVALVGLVALAIFLPILSLLGSIK